MGNVHFERSRNSLLHCGFSQKQTAKILKSLESFLDENSPQLIRSSFDNFRVSVRPKKAEFEKYDQDFKNVFVNQESKLLLLGDEYIAERIGNLKSLDCVVGSSHLWRLFLYAPFGFFMQEWTHLLKKYYYISLKILPQFETKDRNSKNDTLHPVLSYPEVIEQDYIAIKTRNIFMQRTGLDLIQSTVANTTQFNLKTLILSDPEEYLKIYAPHCTVEELNALYYLNQTESGEEDDALFEELVELAPKSGNQKSSFIKTNLTENFVIGSNWIE